MTGAVCYDVEMLLLLFAATRERALRAMLERDYADARRCLFYAAAM